jgi:peroxiredoxin
MTIKVGDRIPNATLNYLKDGVQAITTDEIFKGKKVVLFSVPGAFTPTCSAKHLPGYVEKFAGSKPRASTLPASPSTTRSSWRPGQRTSILPDSLLMLADGNGVLKALGLEMDETHSAWACVSFLRCTPTTVSSSS